MEKTDTRTICTAENFPEFRQRLRDECPEAYALAKELHALGLIDGLSGARIRRTTDPAWQDDARAVQVSEPQRAAKTPAARR